MTFKQFLYLLGGAALTSLVYIILVVVFVFLTFTLGGQKLSEKEGLDAFMFYGCMLAICFTLWRAYVVMKSDRKFYAIGIAIPAVAACYGLFLIGQIYVGDLNYHEAFDKERWNHSEYKPFKMAKTLIKDGDLIGQTKPQLVEKLGTPPGRTSSDPNEGMTYRTDYEGWEMHLHFRDGKLFEVYLYQMGLDL